MYKMMISPGFFLFFFSISIFLAVKGVKGQKIAQNEKITITFVTRRHSTGTVMIMIFGALVQNDDISRHFFIFSKF